VEEEARWFFGELGGKVPQGTGGEGLIARVAAARIDGWLRAIPAYHRGVLSLRFVPREWPEFLREEFEELTSLVVRLECTLHPAVGVPTAALELASVERLEGALALAGPRRARYRSSERRRPLRPEERLIARLHGRACTHLDSALSALAEVRGDEPCVVPTGAP
jgi:hypothetical protein